MVPKYIRYFACTDSSAIGALALELCKYMQQIAPVRTISMSGVFVDEWFHQMHTTTTPIEEGAPFINVVACDPSRWTWMQSVPMPERDGFAGALAGVPVDTGKVEVASERMSLYTDGVRNVLYAVAPPRSMDELAAARRFEAICVPNETHRVWWKEHGDLDVEILGYPMLDVTVRRLVVGP